MVKVLGGQLFHSPKRGVQIDMKFATANLYEYTDIGKELLPFE